MINFHYVRYKNFLASGNYWTQLDFNDTSNTLIIGSNGSGKSSCLDALCFVLYGKAFRNINKPNLINSINQKDCLVEVEFTTNGSKYKIIRGMKPNIFEIYKDKELMNKDSSDRDYQALLERSILKFNYKSFTQIVIIGSASFKHFMHLKPSERREVIEDILDINIFSTMNLIIKNKISENNSSISETKSRLELVQQKYELEKKYINNIRQDNTGKISNYQKDIDTYNSNLAEFQGKIEKLQGEIETLQGKVLLAETVERKLEKLKNIKYTITNKLKKKKKDIQFFTSHDICPICNQNIDLEFKDNNITKLNREVESINDGYSKLMDKISENIKNLREIENIQNKIHNAQVMISSYNTSINETTKYIQNVQKNIEELNKQSAIILDDSNLDRLYNEVESIKTTLTELLEKRIYYDTAYNLLKDSGVKTRIIKQYIPIINQIVNKYLNILDFFVNFQLDENFKETIKSRHRDDFGYNNFSEGEKSRINLALLLAWREVAKIKNSTNTNILIPDEVFDSSLDDDGIENLLNIFHSMDKVNIHVISHKGDTLIDKFDRIIKFEKIKNFSKMKKL